LAGVGIDKKYGYIDPNGNYIVELCLDDLYLTFNGVGKFKVGDRIGYVDKTGEIVMEP